MKRITILFTFIYTCFTLSSQAQWNQKISGTLNTLYDIHFPTIDIGYAVGDSGTALKSIDAGETWTALNTGTQSSLKGVKFLNVDTGFVILGDLYAVGGGGILKTTNGGVSWTQVSIPTSRALKDIKFINSQVGFCVGEQGAILKTTDGGDTWNIKPSGSTDWLSCISFPTPDTGYISTGWNYEFLKTIDGGETWNTIPINTAFSNVIVAVYFTDTCTGFIGGFYDPYFAKTTDGGNSWIDKNTFYISIFSIYFPSPANGYAVGGTTSGPRILHTTDSGNTWSDQYSGISGNLSFLSVYFTNDMTGYTVGQKGTILKASNGGVGINEHAKKKDEIKFYPNPLTSSSTLQLTTQLKDAQVVIYDMLGKEMVRKKLTEDRMEIRPGESVLWRIERGSLESGVYFVRVREGERQWVGKVVVE